MAAHNELGKWGEEMAADYLQSKGYVILERDWRSGRYDIDLVAQDIATIVFVEVKTRRDTKYIQPEQAVDYRKMLHLKTAMNNYVKYRRNVRNFRFDIVTVVGEIGSQPVINHIEDVRIL